MSGPLKGVREHRAEFTDGRMACTACGQELHSMRFGVWLIWISLESGQVCQEGPAS